MKKKTLTIEFDNDDALQCFASWLCNMGEQEYWLSMEYMEQDQPKGNITVTEFHYHGPQKTDGGYGEFMEDNTIRTTCGRLDKSR